MKIKLPNTCIVTNTQNGRLIIKMPYQEGWDILQLIANHNNMKVVEIAKKLDVNVYQDHIIIDNTAL